ncbi:MBL fold metallo-hydrolase [Micromonospora sp. HUAS LYJ1]|uniref:MBL fold metallo-hydrolase n=1 Tax=Micromonospora sp. HUAS LYJ1 TaxID=3061626 RepID=UPI002672B16D|nr:MBL fold metallo-hydrolase [Micromonospora sp. HUAS LYJ1]WKU03525.1 MBL fold metallo-hydrolase [Micromonospora sp. HUAS LYJ1]
MTSDDGGLDDWTAPGAFEVAPGVQRVPLPLPDDGLRAVNVYVLRHDGGATLVDSGWAIAEARVALADALESLDLSVGDVRRFLVTHVHRDHYTQAVHLRREFGMRVSLGAGERRNLETIKAADRDPLAEQLDQLRLLGAEALADALARVAGDRVPSADWELPDDWLHGGSEVTSGGRTLHVVETPGHTRGHVVFHDTASRLLFAGDHVLPTITPSIGFEPVLSANPLGDFLGSLALVRQRPDAWLLPAHGPVTPSVHARVDELVAHHGGRLDEAEAAVARGAQSAYEVASLLRWTRRERELGDLDPFNGMLAVRETAAHLELLMAQGRLIRADIDGVRRYANA